jgi:hypothetical protein
MRVILSEVACSKELCSNRQKAVCQLLLHHFFTRAESSQSTGSAGDLVVPSQSLGHCVYIYVCVCVFLSCIQLLGI